RGTGDGRSEAHDGESGCAERGRSRLSPDGRAMGQPPRVPRGGGSGVQGGGAAERLHRAVAAPVADTGEGSGRVVTGECAAPVIRDAKPQDLESLTDLWFTGWQDGHAGLTPAELARFRTRGSFRERLEAAFDTVRVAETAEGIRGFSMIKGDE